MSLICDWRHKTAYADCTLMKRLIISEYYSDPSPFQITRRFDISITVYLDIAYI